MRLPDALAVLWLGATALAAGKPDTFHESLTLHPLPDGQLSVLFQFTTQFSLHNNAAGERIEESHHSLTPPGLLLPLERSGASEITVSFTSGQWQQTRFGETGPLHYDTGGSGGEIRAWLREGEGDTDEAWDAVRQALGGLFCAGVGSQHTGATVRTYGQLYPPARREANLTHYYLNAPYLRLCTENLTPFLSLLPSKGQSGLSKLLAHPRNVLGWGFKTEGIHVVMPSEGQQGQWTGWWEGVVDLVPERGGSRQFSINSVFQETLPRAFPRASSSVLRVIRPEDDNFKIDHAPIRDLQTYIDGKYRDVSEWDLTDKSLVGQDIKFSWEGEGNFVYPQAFQPPAITIQRAVTDRHGGDGTFHVEINNNGDSNREVLYSEFWPWWVKGWISEMTARSVAYDGGNATDPLHKFNYIASVPPTASTTTLRLRLTLPAQSTTTIEVPFTKLMLKYTDHVPDAERGREISSSILTLLDVQGEEGWGTSRMTGGKPVVGERDELRSARTRIYGPKLLVDIPVPDFSMPYNVIIMSCTIMAIFFGSVHGRLVRRWAWLYTPKTVETAETVEIVKKIQ